MKTIFNQFIVDSSELLGDDIGRIVNVFTEPDITLLTVERGCYFRVFDLLLLDKLQRYPVIISHHIDLSDYPELSHSAGLAIEVANKQDIADVSRHAPDVLIGKSFESSGIAKECSALVLYQLLIKQSIPFSIHANTGYELFQAYLTTGVYGIVLPLKYLREDASPTLRFNLDKLTSLRLEIAGGPPKAHFYQKMLSDRGTLSFIQETHQLELWEKLLKPTERATITRKVLRYKEIASYKNSYTKEPCFYPNSPAALALNVRLPIVQGPMSGVTITADFAVAIHQSGAFPFLALASLSNDEVDSIVAKTAAKKIDFGVGIVAVSLTDEDFDIQLQIFEKYKPSLVLVGTPQLNHIQRLLNTNLKIAVHAPNKALFKALYGMGVRCFVIEGGEAGGHISNLGGLTAWQEIFNEVRKQSIQDEVHLILAGGIRGTEAKDLITSLLNFYGFEHTLKISLQLGSTYLATKQALALTPLNKGFQEQLFNVDDTFVTGESLSRGVRQLAIKNSAKTLTKEWAIFDSELSHEDKKREYEKLYHGGLTRAIITETFVETGSYMAGSVSALLDTPLNIDDIHDELVDPAPVQTSQQAPEPIAIVGIGLKLPGAESVAEHFYNIFHQRCFITDMPEDHFDRELYLSTDKEEELTSYTSLGAFINKLDDDLSQYRIPPIIANQMSKSQKMALDASHKALVDAGYFEKPFNKERTAVIIGAGGGSNDESLSKIDWPEIRSRLMNLSETTDIDLGEILDEYETRYFNKDITEDTRPGQLTNIIAARVASVFDFKGENHTIDAACAASLASVAHAMSLLRNHSSDVVLAGGIEERMGKDIYIEFSRIGAVSEKGCFSLDSKADGFVLGEGAVMYVLKRYSDAIKFGDKIYGVINGWGASFDGAGKGITAPNKEGQILALKRAYQDAQISPSSVDYIECHATATKVGDSTEFEGLSEVLKASNTHKKPVLGASKAMIGHLRTGAGAAGILQSLFVINNRYFPATINFQSHSQGSQLPFEILQIPKKVEHDNKIVSSVSSFGFGGTNYHLVLSSADDNSASPILSAQQMELPVYNYTGDMAWVCPGQGSQYEGMLAAYKHEPDFIQLAEQAVAIFAEYSPVDLLQLLTEVDSAGREKNEALLKATEISQPAIFFTSIIIGKKLLKLGLKPDLLIGHSLGEYSALCLAGMLSFAEAFRMVCIRGTLMSADLVENAGIMVAIMGDEALAEKLFQKTQHYAVCANLNAYNQTIISCSEAALDDILKAADELQVRATQLKVARGFHSRFVSHCVAEMMQALKGCQFYYPNNRVTANIKNQSYPYHPDRCQQLMSEVDRDQTLALLKCQIDHPVHFINQIQSAYASGIRRFIEVGPGNVLTRLIEQINQGKYLQSIYINKQGEESFDFASLPKRLLQEVDIKRVPLPKREATQKKSKAQLKPRLSTARSIIDEIRAVVANVSGYELGSFDDNAEFERDLGIDTLKIFEILAQLRGNVLADEITDFRKLNSIHSLYEARDQSQDVMDVQSTPEKELVVYQYKQHIKEDVNLLALNLSDFIIHADNGFSNTTLEAGYKLLIFKVADCAEDLRNRVYPLLYNKARDYIAEKSQKIIFISYGAGALQEASILSISAFVKSVAKDYNGAEWHYNHFDELPSYENLGKQIVSGIGLHCLNDQVIQGKMQRMQGFQTGLREIPTQLSCKDHIVVTGGARGIASHLVKKLYAVCQARFTLIGRKQDSEDWIQALDSQRINYLSIDIADKNAVEKHRAQLSDCTILIHSAGIDHSKHFMQKSYAEFFEVIDVKVAGLFNLLALMSEESIRALVLFSSTVSYRGNDGQTDYATANAVLNSKIGAFPCLSLAWTAWDEIGMASRGFIHDILMAKGARFIGLDEGSDIFQNTLASFLGNPCATHSQLLIAAKIPEDDALYCTELEAIHSIDDLDKSFVIEFTYDSQQFPELLDHQFDGNIFVPGSVILGSVLHEIHKKYKLGNLNVELGKVEFLSPLIVIDSVPNRLKITRQKNDFLVEEIKQQLTIPIATFAVNLAVDEEELNDADIKTRFDNTLANLKVSDYSCRRAHSELGENFQILEKVSLNQGIIRTTLHLKAASAPLLQRLFAVSNLLEACFQSSSTAVHLLKDPKSVYLPSALGKARISFKALRETNVLQLYIELLESQSKGVTFNILGVNELGKQVINIKAFTASPVFDTKCQDYYIFKNTLIKDSLSEGFFADIKELNQQFYDDNYFTENELNEINALNSSKRKNEKKSGKIACKILTNWQALKQAEMSACLKSTEVLSPEKPVQVLHNGKSNVEFPFYSISHSEGGIYAARSAYPIGIDIEKIRSLDELTIKNIYGTQSAHINNTLDNMDMSAELLDLFPLILFTQKEAALKANGVGLGEGLDLAVIENFSSYDALININAKKYSVFSSIANDFVVSKAFLLPAESTEKVLILPLKKKQSTKFQQTLLQEEKGHTYSYSLNHVIEFTDTVNLKALNSAINKVIESHDVLRSRFSAEDNQVFIAPFVKQEFIVEKSHQSVTAIEEQFINDYSRYHYELSNEALYHIKLYQTDKGATIVLMNFHHLILDCYNAFILSESILKHYQQLKQGKALLPESHEQYYDLGVEATFQQGKSFWSEYLAGIDIFTFAKPSGINNDNGKHFKTINPINKKGLENFCRSHSITLFVGLLGVLKLTFLKLYDKNDIAFLIPFSEKNSQNHPTLGSFIHLLPVRSKIEKNQSYDALLSALRENLYTAIEHHNEQIDAAGLKDNHGLIAQLINSDDQSGLFSEHVKRRNTDGKNAHSPLIFSFINSNDTIHLDITFNADIVSENQLNEILDCFQEELNTVVNSTYIDKTSTSLVSPQSATESILLTIWKEVFEIETIGIHDNFFDLGGHSLLAVVIRTNIETKLNKKIPIELVFQEPTVSLLTKSLDKYADGITNNFSSIITAVNTAGSLPPLFCFLGARITPIIQEYIETNRPYYLLNHQALNGKKAKYLTIPEMADYYIQAITQIDSEGPYYLAGFSLGGMLIYEIAQQLSIRGKKVALLFLIDPVGGANDSSRVHNREIEEGLSEYNKFKKLGVNTYFNNIAGIVKQQLTQNFNKARVQAYFSMGKTLPTELVWPYHVNLYRKANSSYFPKPPLDGIEKTILILGKDANPKCWESTVKDKADIYATQSLHLQLTEKPFCFEWIEIFVDAISKK
ncbi:MAG: SDR family NAD(P)-dependent oxidoreductase [Methyloprofundus sp.]|nr:SDR family NAD(P)-dependent oxidoreductase [Methyloprofundus sp.]